MINIVERLRSHLDVFRSYPKQTGADDMAGVVQSIEMAADEIERLRDAVGEIRQWASAYPEDIFRPVSEDKLKEASGALKAIGVDMGALHAGWARHLIGGIDGIARSALGEAKDE